MFEGGGANLVDSSSLGDLFKGVFEGKSLYNNSRNKRQSLQQALKNDGSIVIFNRSLFDARRSNQLNFVRNILHSLVQRSECSQYIDVRLWSPYVQVALILLEGEISNDLIQVKTVAKRILSGSRSAKDDPRLWIAYALIELKSPDIRKARKSALKILLSALKAVENVSNNHARGWVELSILAVKILLEITIVPKVSVEILKPTRANVEKSLHIICCAVEGKYTESAKQDDATLVSDERYNNARMIVRKYMVKVESQENETTSIYDLTPIWAWFATLDAWLSILRPTNGNLLAFNDGICVIQDWIKMTKYKTMVKAKRNGITWLVNLCLEFSLLSSIQRNEDISGNQLCPHVMNGAVALFRESCTPSQSFLISTIIVESALKPKIKHNYSKIIFSKVEHWSNELIFVLASTINFPSESNIHDRNECKIEPSSCAHWSKDKISRVRETLQNIVSSPFGSTMPCFWKALVRLELFGGSQREGTTYKVPTKAFFAARQVFEQGISSCISSKALWLDAFSILRPAFTREELPIQVSVMEEKGLRIVQEITS